MASPTLYQLVPSSRRGELDVTPVWSQDGAGPLAPGGYRHIVTIGPSLLGDDVHLLAIDEHGLSTVFRVRAGAPHFEPVDAAIDLTGKTPTGEPLPGEWDIVRSFVLGDMPYLLTYAAERGQFAFFPLTAELGTRPPYLFRRVREPGPTAGFDTVEPIVVGSFVYYMCYSSESGKVVIYSLQATATAWEGQAPLFSRAVWVHEWAARWMRFAFFRQGSGVYFLKTNVGRLNVNIDHVLDDPSQGAVEVAGHLDLPDALELDTVAPFTTAEGDPWFVTYRRNGRTTCNRFHGDASGWTQEAGLDTVTDADHVVPIAVGDDRFLLLC